MCCSICLNMYVLKLWEFLLINGFFYTCIPVQLDRKKIKNFPKNLFEESCVCYSAQFLHHSHQAFCAVFPLYTWDSLADCFHDNGKINS